MNQAKPTHIVTGASAGMGTAVARRLVQTGRRVIAPGRNEAALEALREELGPDFDPFTADLSEPDQIETFCESVTNESIKLKGLIFCSGLAVPAKVTQTTAESVDQMFDINTRAPMLLTARLAGLLQDSNGDVVFINSSASRTPGMDRAVYSASKAALASFADCVRGELNPGGVRVATIYPGRTATPGVEPVRQYYRDTVDMRRLLQPDDIAALVIHILDAPDNVEITDIHLRRRWPD
ncbi:SDR family oxidoreductase [Lentisalinibacter sediminis]|uniref:SDR family oxidoreductase n=1 Tax=Lentisalinibacter sediminis TaxID=2992237 RepID=UPI0038650F6F